MALFKFCAVFAALAVIVRASSVNIDNKTINAVNDVVLEKQSNTCVILVIEGKVKFVSTAADAVLKLAKLRNVIKKAKMQIIKSSFRSLKPKDVLEKLVKISKAHLSFLVYFTAPAYRRPVKGAIASEVTKPVGLIGELLDALGLKLEEEGLLPILLYMLGFNTNEKEVQIIEFAY